MIPERRKVAVCLMYMAAIFAFIDYQRRVPDANWYEWCADNFDCVSDPWERLVWWSMRLRPYQINFEYIEYLMQSENVS